MSGAAAAVRVAMSGARASAANAARIGYTAGCRHSCSDAPLAAAPLPSSCCGPNATSSETSPRPMSKQLMPSGHCSPLSQGFSTAATATQHASYAVLLPQPPSDPPTCFARAASHLRETPSTTHATSRPGMPAPASRHAGRMKSSGHASPLGPTPTAEAQALPTCPSRPGVRLCPQDAQAPLSPRHCQSGG